MKLSISQIAEAVSAQNSIDDRNINITSVSFDSRKLKPGALFVPLMGNQDGHKYIDSAIKNGAIATLWQSDHKLPSGIPALVVDNTLNSLQELSKYYLNIVNPKVIAVTGSNGKTTTKDMIASTLSNKYKVSKTYKNYNNGIGVPITVLSMDNDTDILVVEMGMDRPGQLTHLSNLVHPDIDVITMIGEAHIEYFGTRDRIADAKMEITNGLKKNGTLIFNGDEPLLRERVKRLSSTKLLTFGQSDHNDIYSNNLKEQGKSIIFNVNLFPNKQFKIPMIGTYNVNNALVAIKISLCFHLNLDEIMNGLENVQLTENRTEWFKGNKGEQILSDVYNSNPTAARAVLKAFANISTKGKRIIVLGDMLELGNKSSQMHASLANDIDYKKFKEVYLIGNDIESLNRKLQSKYSKNDLHYYQAGDLSNLFNDLHQVVNPDDLVLLKASHGIHLEKIVEKMIY